MTTLRSLPLPRVEPPTNPVIVLTDVEARICNLLDECTQYIHSEHGLVTSCRIAGGWVRDKLLGSQSNDLDIALTDMMGTTFAEHFVSYLSTVKHLPVGKIATIEQNPEQSKHLATAHTTVLGTELDFVNLRSEEYAEHSRIPTEVAFGTPLQDALRRDITMNALFYNVHTRAVEDHTGQGLPDLQTGTIRTPLPPRETFQDDPLRVLRCVRFASRFGFEMVPELQDAARDPVVQEALMLKISRERVGIEVDKMMTGRSPLRALQLIHSLRLSPSVFSIPLGITASSSPASFSISLGAATVLHALLYPSIPPSLPHLHPLLRNDLQPADEARLFLATAFTHLCGITYTDAKKKEHAAVESAIRDGLKLGTRNHYLDGIPVLFRAAELLRDPQVRVERPGARPERVAIGLLLRDKAVHDPVKGTFWKTSVLFSLVQELVPFYDVEREKLDEESAARVIEAYNNFLEHVVALDLPAAVDARPLLDGREVVFALGASKPGMWTGKALAQVVKWQLEHPTGSKEECVAWLEAERQAGRIQVEDQKGGAEQGKRKGRRKADVTEEDGEAVVGEKKKKRR